MTALPANLALVGDDLARATFIDARRSYRRRRLATCAVAFALFALTASAAVANGWLFGGSTPVLHAVPSLSGPAPAGAFAPSNAIAAAADMAQSVAAHRDPAGDSRLAAPLGSADRADSRTLLTGLGAKNTSLSVVTTTSGGVCLVLTGFSVQCVATFTADQEIAWFSSSPSATDDVVWGIVRDDVIAVEAVATDGSVHGAKVANGGFYVDIGDSSPERLIVHLADGSSDNVTPLPCPLTTPDCNP
jgi:hypothetical protein